MPIKRANTFSGAGEVPLWAGPVVIFICRGKLMLQTGDTGPWDE